MPGHALERKHFSLAVHYRQVEDARVGEVASAVEEVLAGNTRLVKGLGKKVFELRPRLDWDKGKAVLWVLRTLGLDRNEVMPFYLGDDTTDEDAFAVLQGRGIGILVGCPARETAARYVLDRPADVERFVADELMKIPGIAYAMTRGDLLAGRIKQLWQRFQDYEHSLKNIKQQMAAIYTHLLENGEQLPPVIKGFVSIENLARIAGETGPFDDFNSARQIKRYGGLNIRIRQSGYFKGKPKLSKKGRPRLRLILNQSIFRLIKKECILGPYYHGLKERGMSGTKAMAVVSRKLVDILFALSRPGVIFDEKRLFVCKENYKNAA